MSRRYNQFIGNRQDGSLFAKLSGLTGEDVERLKLMAATSGVSVESLLNAQVGNEVQKQPVTQFSEKGNSGNNNPLSGSGLLNITISRQSAGTGITLPVVIGLPSAMRNNYKGVFTEPSTYTLKALYGGAIFDGRPSTATAATFGNPETDGIIATDSVLNTRGLDDELVFFYSNGTVGDSIKITAGDGIKYPELMEKLKSGFIKYNNIKLTVPSAQAPSQFEKEITFIERNLMGRQSQNPFTPLSLYDPYQNIANILNLPVKGILNDDNGIIVNIGAFTGDVTLTFTVYDWTKAVGSN